MVFILIGLSMDKKAGWLGGFVYLLLILFFNVFQFRYYRRYFKNHRCENCGSMHLRVIGKNIDGFERTNVTHYINSETKEKYLKKHTHVVTNTTYYTYCPDCNSLFEWTEEDEENFRKDTRPEDLRD